MAKKTRKGGKGLLVRGLAIGAGIGAGAMLLPKIVSAVDKNGTLDPKLASAVGAGAALFGATKTSGITQDVMLGVAGGQVWNLISNFVGVSGIGYETYPGTTDVNRVAGDTFGGTMDVGVDL